MGVPASLSSVPDVAPYQQYVAAGGQTVYPYPFPITEDSDLIVVVNGVTQPTDSTYSVSGAGNSTGGNVTLNSGSTAGDIITLFRDIPIERISQIAQNSGFSSTVFNNEFNNFYLIAQQLDAEIAQCLKIPNTNSPAPTTALLPSAYAGKYLAFDANGNPTPALLTPSGTLTAAIITGLISGVTAAESAAGISTINTSYPLVGDLRRYGGDPTGANDSSAALQSAVNLGLVYVAPGCTYKILTGTTKTGPLAVWGQGNTSIFACDSNVITVTNGSGSMVDGIRLVNITAPWIITRNPENWAASILGTLQQSNTVDGYQPSVNDGDVWSSLTTAQQNQQINCVLQFQGAASRITVRNITGRFARIAILDATRSMIENIDIFGGKGQFGSVIFDNWTNGVQRGSGNVMRNIRVRFGSFSGCWFAANDDGSAWNIDSQFTGESGCQTAQTNGVLFSASVGGGTTATISQPSGGFALANGTYIWQFDDTTVKSVTVSSAGTAASWTGALNAGSILSASSYGGPGSPNNSQINPQCFRIDFGNIHCANNYYDGVDLCSTFDTTVDAPYTYHQGVNLRGYNNGGDGINLDGRHNNYSALRAEQNYRFGIWGVGLSDSNVTGVSVVGNNLGADASTGDFALGPRNCKVSDVRCVFTASAGFPISYRQAVGAVPHTISHCHTEGGTNDFGATLVASLMDVTDASTGQQTDQSFIIAYQNAASVLQHAFYGDGTLGGPGIMQRVNGASSGGFTTTPTAADASTAFAAGLKIGSANTNYMWVDTPPQFTGAISINASIVFNSTGTALTAVASFRSLNINGVTRIRLVIEFYNATSGAAFNLAGISASAVIRVKFTGKLAG